VAAGGVTSGLVGMSQRVTWRAKHFGVWQTLTSEITALDRPAYFQDVMLQGAFRFMRHDHYFRTASGGQTEMRDVFCFAAPVPGVGLVIEALVLRRYMQALLRERNAAIREFAESEEWRKVLP
jgi:ligand-binding SRPBCC domain-containing protein